MVENSRGIFQGDASDKQSHMRTYKCMKGGTIVVLCLQTPSTTFRGVESIVKLGKVATFKF
jgi:hypothetical protein